MTSLAPGTRVSRSASASSIVRRNRWLPGPCSPTGRAPVAITSRSNGYSPGIGQDHSVAELLGPLAEPEVGAERVELSPQRGVVDLALHELLRQRRPVVRRPDLGPDQGDRTLVAERPQLLDGAHPGQAAARHHDPCRIARRHLVLQHSIWLPGPSRRRPITSGASYLGTKLGIDARESGADRTERAAGEPPTAEPDPGHAGEGSAMAELEGTHAANAVNGHRTADVLIIGGGVIGLAIAWRAAQRGLRSCWPTPTRVAGASHAAAGMLTPVAEAAYAERELFELGSASLRALSRLRGRAGRADRAADRVPPDRDAARSATTPTTWRCWPSTPCCASRSASLPSRLTSRECRQAEPLLGPAIARRPAGRGRRVHRPAAAHDRAACRAATRPACCTCGSG